MLCRVLLTTFLWLRWHIHGHTVGEDRRTATVFLPVAVLLEYWPSSGFNELTVGQMPFAGQWDEVTSFVCQIWSEIRTTWKVGLSRQSSTDSCILCHSKDIHRVPFVRA